MFLTAQEENTITDVVERCQDKISTNWNGIDMKTVKNVIEWF